MLVSEQKTALKRYGFDNNDPLLVWLNAAMHDLERVTRWSWLERIATVNVTAGQKLAMPANARRIISVKDTVNFNKLSAKNRHWFDRSIADPTLVGSPTYYIWYPGNAFAQLYPVPDVTHSYQLVYTVSLVDLVLDTEHMDTQGVPLDMHYPIVERAAAIGLMAENEEERANTADKQFRDAVNDAIDADSDKEDDEPKQVEDVMGYTGGYNL